MAARTGDWEFGIEAPGTPPTVRTIVEVRFSLIVST